MTQPFQISMLFRADVSAAQTGMETIRAGLEKVKTASGTVAAGMAETAREIAAATANTQTHALGLGNAERKALNFGQVWARSTTAIDRASTALLGLNNSIGAQGHELAQAMSASHAYQAEMENIRARFNPLFAASKRYEAHLRDIAEAERLGAISAREAADARARASAIITPIQDISTKGGGVNSFASANLAAQFNDIGVMLAAGQNPLQLALQQGTQISQVLTQMSGKAGVLSALGQGFLSMISPVSLATIAIIGFGAAGAQALTSGGATIKSYDTAVSDLSTGLDRLTEVQTRASAASSKLSADFGSASGQARQLLAEIASLNRITMGGDINASVAQLPAKLKIGLTNPEGERNELRRRFGFGLLDENGWQMAGAVRDAASGVKNAPKDDLEAQFAAVTKFRDTYEAAAKAAGGITVEEAKQLLILNEQVKLLDQTRGSDQKKAAKAELDQRHDDSAKRLEVEAAILQFGRKSAEVRAVENRQAREALAARLDELGFDRSSAEAKKAFADLAKEGQLRERAADEERVRAGQELLRGLNEEATVQRAILRYGEDSKEAEAARNQVAKERLRQRMLEQGIAWGDVKAAEALLAVQQELTTQIQLQAAEKSARTTLRELEGEADIARLTMLYGQQSLEVKTRQVEVQRRVFEESLKTLRVSEQLKDSMRAAWENANGLAATRFSETFSAGHNQLQGLRDQLAVRQEVAAIIASGKAPASEANRLMQEEAALRPLITAAAQAEGVQKERLLGIITALRLGQAALDSDNRRVAANDYLRSQAERVQQLHVEIALLGQHEIVRRRVMAQIEAEQKIRVLGLDTTGAAARAMRQQAREIAEQSRLIENQAKAWENVSKAAESAIDTTVDKLSKGDLRGALAGMLGEIKGQILDLGVKNPLKNLILGTDYTTLGDMGGYGGIWQRLTGKQPVDENRIAAMGTKQVQAMQIAATSVTINAAGLNLQGGANSLLGAVPSASDMAGFGKAVGGPIAQQVWSFFAGKGLKPHQISGIMGAVQAESGFNPTIPGDNGNAVGLFQHNGPRMRALLSGIGGRGNLGNVQAQLEFVWREFMTTEMSSYRKLMDAATVEAAAWAMQGFERPEGYKSKIYGSGKHWDKRLAAANQYYGQMGAGQVGAAPNPPTQEIEQLGAAARKSTAQLADMGAGMGQFGGALTQLIGAVSSGDGNSVLSTLVGLGANWLGGQFKGFATGGHTGGSDPTRVAGVVHEKEYVFDAESTRKIGVGNLERLRRGVLKGYAQGGYVTTAPGFQALGSQPQSAGVGGGDSIHMTFDLRGTQGDAAIERKIATAVSFAVEELNKKLPERIRQVSADPRKL